MMAKMTVRRVKKEIRNKMTLKRKKRKHISNMTKPYAGK